MATRRCTCEGRVDENVIDPSALIAVALVRVLVPVCVKKREKGKKKIICLHCGSARSCTGHCVCVYICIYIYMYIDVYIYMYM